MKQEKRHYEQSAAVQSVETKDIHVGQTPHPTLRATFSRHWGEGKNGFTLAEVLITLGIIGVVAAMTLPTLIQKNNDKVTLTKLKKFYSSSSQAYARAIAENDTPDTWGDYNAMTQKEMTTNMFNKLRPYLSVTKDCGYNEGCFPNLKYKKFNGADSINFITDVNKRYMFKLQDGSAIAIVGLKPTALILGSFGGIYLDVNGDNPPNTFGKDMFQLTFLKDRIIPTNLNRPDKEFILSDCLNTGYSCFGWVISHDNLDYQHCPDSISWDGKTSCK